MWSCQFCHTRNPFPAHYAGISETNLPAELFPQYVSVAYTMRQRAPPPAFVFVLDTCQPKEDLSALVDSIKQTLGSLPERSVVGFITFGERVHLYELGHTACSKLWVLRGDASIPKEKLASMLLLSPAGAKGAAPDPNAAGGCEGRFLVPLSECEFALEAALDELLPDAQQSEAGFRPKRCTGAAMDIAVSLLEAAGGVSFGRVMMFLSGPITHGPGQVVERDLAIPLRCHKDFDKGTNVAKHFKKSHAFFTGVASRAVAASAAVDLFACAMDQVGVAEMAPTAERTGGMIVLADGFDHPVYRNTLNRMFERDPATGLSRMGFQATSEVFCSREIKVSGCIGSVTVAPAGSAGASANGAAAGRVSETEMGCGGTTSWRLGCVDERSSYAYYFEISQSHNNAIRPGDAFYIQFQTRYVSPDTGEVKVRVLTLARRWCDPSRLDELVAGFDQEAAGALMARISVWRGETEDAFDVLRWLDRTLIRLCAKFGEYQKEDASSFRLSPYMSLYPQFVFHLRRSPFLQVFNSSPDETAYFRSVLNREAVSGAAIMIQPTLLRYGLDPAGGAPQGVPVVLDVSALAPDVVLLLDTYFRVTVWSGSTIASWRDAGYDKLPEHAAFAELLEQPLRDARTLLADRLPMPMLLECDQGGSQSRFVLARLNPSSTHNTSGAGGSEVIFTDDVSLEVFLEHLAKLAVAGTQV